MFGAELKLGRLLKRLTFIPFIIISDFTKSVGTGNTLEDCGVWNRIIIRKQDSQPGAMVSPKTKPNILSAALRRKHRLPPRFQSLKSETHFT